MEYNNLDELMKIQKKGEAPKAKKALYEKEMSVLLENEGLSEKAVSYLKTGFSFSGARPFATYLHSIQKEMRKEAIDALLASEIFKGDDKTIAFRYAISLLGFSITFFPDDPSLLVEIIKVIPTKAYNKEKTILKDAPKIVDKYFLSMIKADTSLPELYSLGIKDAFIRDFCKVLSSSLEQVKAASPQVREKVSSWLGQKTQEEKVMSSSMLKKPTDAHVEPLTENRTPIAEISLVTGEDVPVNKPYSKKELQDAMAFIRLFTSRMDVTVRTWETLKKEVESKQQQIEASNQALSSTQKHLENAVSENKRLVEEVTAANQTASDLRFQLSDANTIIGKKDSEIDALQKELEKMRSVLSVYTADKQSSQSEQLNAIASKLKSEYRDFKDAENEEMTLDLGENFRFQLQSVFRILAKAGIDIEKR